MRPDPLVSAFEQVSARDPDAALLLSRSAVFTAADIDSLARRLERELRAAGIPEGTPIGLVAPDGPGFLAGLVASLRRDNAPILIGSRATDREIDDVLERFGASACLTDRGDGLRAPAVDIRRSPWSGAGRLSTGPGVIKLSSGSTGQPRGVLSPTEALLADDEALTRSMELESDDRVIAAVPFSHSYGLSSLVVPCLARGRTLVLPEGEGPFAVLDAARDGSATVLPTAPAYVAALLRVPETPPLAESVRRVIVAGAPVLPDVAVRFRERFGRRLHAFYGASECGGITYDPTGSAAERETVGVPVHGVRVDLRPVGEPSPSGAGRVVVSSPAVAVRYLPDASPELADGVFTTDDLAVMRGGELALTGRVSQLINVRGRKVNPVEVERVIAQLTGVDEVSVTGVFDPATGDQSVAAAVVCRTGGLTSTEIGAWCRDRLSPFKIPRRICIVDRLPRTARGKIDPARLAELVGEGGAREPAE